MSINLFFLLDTSEAYSSVFSPPGCRSPPRRRRRSSPVAGGAQPGVSLSLYLCRLLTSPWASASSSISGAPPSADRPAPPRCAPSPPTPQPPPPLLRSLPDSPSPAEATSATSATAKTLDRSEAGPCLALSTQDLYRSHSHRALMTWSSCCGSRRIVASTTHALACPRICG